MSDYDSNDGILFTVETRGYVYEPEYTEEELLQRRNGLLRRNTQES